MCSRDQSLVAVAFLSEKLSQTQCYKDLTRKTVFFRCDLGSSSIIWDWHLALVTNLNFYTSVTKRLKLKVRKFWRLIPTFVEVTGGKLVAKLPTPSS